MNDEEKHKSTRKMLDTVWDDCLKLNKETEIIYEVVEDVDVSQDLDRSGRGE